MCGSRREAKIHPRPRRGCKVYFKPGSHIGPAMAAGREIRHGETRGVVRGRSNGAAGGCIVRGNSPQPSDGGSRGIEGARGNPRTHRRQCRKMRCAGNRACIKRRRGRGDAGKPGDSFDAMLKDGRFEAPRSSIAGTAERCAPPGNSRTHREAERDDAWSRQPEFIAIRASEIPESLAPLFLWLTSARRITLYS
jgi:hypothetical protein